MRSGYRRSARRWIRRPADGTPGRGRLPGQGRLAGSISCAPHFVCGAMDGPPHPLKRSATADRIRHRLVDFGVARDRVRAQERGRGHDHAGLTVAALRDIFGHPALLTALAAFAGEPFEIVKALLYRAPERKLAGADGNAAAGDGT